MFEECRWREEDINCEDYLEMIPTGLGFCYKFNPEQKENNKTLSVLRTGSDFGLHLRINVQHSEYYYGPGTAIGMKVRKRSRALHLQQNEHHCQRSDIYYIIYI